MSREIVRVQQAELVEASGGTIPALIAAAGEDAVTRFVEFFTANIRNKNTRRAYFRNAITFLRWCEERGITDLKAIKPVLVAAYVEDLRRRSRSRPSSSTSRPSACSSTGSSSARSSPPTPPPPSAARSTS